MVTSAFLHTRGRERHRDYQFVGPAPPTSWWREYADHTTFEHPTILVQSDGDRWQAYLSGIPSGRRDAVGTVIRYTVVLEGPVGQDPSAPDAGGLGARDVLALVANWLEDQDRATGRVAAVLDAAFPEPDVERLLGPSGGARRDGAARDDSATRDDSGARADEVFGRVTLALRQLERPPADGSAAESTGDPADAADTTDDWLADVTRPASRAAFLHRVDVLLGGRPGRALVLNLVGSPADVTALLDDPRPLAVLAQDLPRAVSPLHRSGAAPRGAPGGAPGKKAPSPPRTRFPVSARRSTGNLRGCLRLALVPIALVVALALALLGTVLVTR